MSINNANVSNRLFDILVGRGNAIVMGDEDGKKTLNPNEAVRFYIKNKHSMVFFDQLEGHIHLSIGNTERMDEVDELRKAIRDTAHHFGLGYTVKNFGKKLEPKDFAFQLEESHAMHGTKRKSYQNMSNARVVITHTRTVNEEVPGARSRSIDKIFIENSQGERFAYPYKFLAGARALAEHVGTGGNPYDAHGQRLIKLAEQYITLRKFVSHANRSNFVNEATASLVKLAEARALQIVRALKTGKGLSEMTALTGINDATRISELQDKFTKKSVNSVVDSALPYVLELLDQQQLREDASNSVIELVAAIEAPTEVELTHMDSSDPDHPKNLEFTNSDVRNKHIAHYLVKHLVDTNLRTKLETLTNQYDSLDAEEKNMVASAIRNLVRKAQVINNEQVVNASVEQQVLSSLHEEIYKYTTSSILAK